MSDEAPWTALVAAVAQRRDREAFTRLFDHFTPRLEAYLLRQGASRTEAEEVAQDAMATLWRKAEQFDPAKSSVATWLYRIARNRRIDRLRRDRLDYVDPMAATLDTKLDETDLDGVLDLQRREDLLRAAVETLPQEQLTLIRLAFFDSLSHSAIAARTGLPLGTVKSRIRLAFARLRKALEANGVIAAS